MLTKVISATTVGLDGVIIKVEVDVADRGLPTFTIVGLPNKSIEESKDRVRTAIHNSLLEMPEAKIVVNLAPADIPKEGSLFDLPIAAGILASSGSIDRKFFKNSIFVGELSLDGKVNPVGGILPIVICAQQEGIANIFLAQKNVYEASLVKNIRIYPVSDLKKLLLHLNGNIKITPAKKISWQNLFVDQQYENDMKDVKGQITAKRALLVAAAGGHNIHLKGPPGSGKTMLAKIFPSIMPSMDEDEIIEVSKIYSVANCYKDTDFIVKRPFRSPHHTISRVGLIGGGTKLNPGEVSMAHRGVLFLDEFPEFPRSVMEALRQPLEDGVVTISRASGTITFPARFIMIAASIPCPCGYLGHPKKPCKCSVGQIIKYKKRISGPLLDRIDIHIDVPPVKETELSSRQNLETSQDFRLKVERARKIQRDRFKNERIKTNSEMTSGQIKKYCRITDKSIEMLKMAFSQLSLSARSYFKIIKIGQTVADLAGDDKIISVYINEAIQYRLKEDE